MILEKNIVSVVLALIIQDCRSRCNGCLRKIITAIEHEVEYYWIERIDPRHP
jgi:hypothetical protein